MPKILKPGSPQIKQQQAPKYAIFVFSQHDAEIRDRLSPIFAFSPTEILTCEGASFFCFVFPQPGAVGIALTAPLFRADAGEEELRAGEGRGY